jgi:hypothetical protein
MGMGMGMGGAAAAMGRGMAMGGMAPVHPFLQAQRGALLPPPKATLYVEGVPMDATEREVYHLFRPFPGLTSLRLRSAGSSARMVGATACLLAWMDGCTPRASAGSRPSPRMSVANASPNSSCNWSMCACMCVSLGQLCFVEFSQQDQAQMAMATLDGYLFDQADGPSGARLKVAFARDQGGGSDGGGGGGAGGGGGRGSSGEGRGGGSDGRSPRERDGGRDERGGGGGGRRRSRSPPPRR